MALGYILRVGWDLLGELTTLQTTLTCLKMFIRAREMAQWVNIIKVMNRISLPGSTWWKKGSTSPASCPLTSAHAPCVPLPKNRHTQIEKCHMRDILNVPNLSQKISISHYNEPIKHLPS